MPDEEEREKKDGGPSISSKTTKRTSMILDGHNIYMIFEF